MFSTETALRWTVDEVLEHVKGIVGDEPESLDDEERKTQVENWGRNKGARWNMALTGTMTKNNRAS